MQIPEKPPVSIADIVANPQGFARNLSPFLREEFLFAHADNYMHWDEVRYRDVPEGFPDHKTYWAFLKMRRSIGRMPLPLKEKSGDAFSFVVADEVQEGLSEADSYLRGIIDADEPLEPSQRDMWLVQSLIEEEAIHSSLLEGAPTTRTKAKKMLAEGRKPRGEGELMVVNNYRAMAFVRERKDEPLSEAMILELHRVITEGTLKNPADAGRFRANDDPDFGVWDAPRNRMLFAPPQVGELPARMRALCEFANAPHESRPFVHPVIRAIVLHFQLAHDHPFVDGNGRTARALFYWLMLKNGYWLAEYVSISEILRKAQTKYARAFLFSESDDGDLTYFILHQLRVLKQAVKKLRDYLDKRRRGARAIKKIADDSLNPRQHDTIARARKNPQWSATVREHRGRHGITMQTARTDLQGLVEMGYLDMHKQGKVHVFYPTDKLMSI